MSKFESGVSGYIKGVYIAEVHFPIDLKGKEHVCCNECFYHNEITNRCALNKEIASIDPSKYVGSNCPLEMDTENE